MHIVLIHKNPDEAALIKRAASTLGHHLHPMQHESELTERCDMLIIDKKTAGKRLTEIIRAMRLYSHAGLPVLCLLARSADADDLIAARESGADDCLFYPIRAGELRVRIDALLKRAYPGAHTPIEKEHFGCFTFELHSGQVQSAGKPVALTRKEFDLALLFFRNLGRPLSRAYVQEAVWGALTDVPTRTIDTHVSRVRTKLGLRPENGYRLAPVYSYGYLLEALDH
jgi:DNA-binding response OmpR family regulator